MKPFEIRLTAHPAERTDSGSIAVTLSMGTRGENATITSLDEIEERAAALAARFDKPCSVWVGPARNGGRKPAGFDKTADAVSKKFRNEPHGEPKHDAG